MSESIAVLLVLLAVGYLSYGAYVGALIAGECQKRDPDIPFLVVVITSTAICWPWFVFEWPRKVYDLARRRK